MSNIWKFCKSSEYLVEKCLTARSLQDNNNKWVQQFTLKEKNFPTISDGSLSTGTITKPTEQNNTSNKPNQNITEVYIEDIKNSEGSKEFEDQFIDSIEAEPIARINSIKEKSLKNVEILKILAQRLSESAIEKICKHIFGTKDMDTIFIQNFFRHFFPEYLKRNNSWLALDLVTLAFKTCHSEFKILLNLILKDSNLPNTYVQNLVQNLNEEDKLDFLTTLMGIQLTAEEFSHHLFSIYLAYKDCQKSVVIQQYIFSCLKDYSIHCISDKNYGKLFLVFLQAQSKQSDFSLDMELTNRLIEMHRSPFKRPCMTIYTNLRSM